MKFAALVDHNGSDLPMLDDSNIVGVSLVAEKIPQNPSFRCLCLLQTVRKNHDIAGGNLCPKVLVEVGLLVPLLSAAIGAHPFSASLTKLLKGAVEAIGLPSLIFVLCLA